MCDFFDFMRDIPPYSVRSISILRLNRRHDLLIKPFSSHIDGARVLDLACHDGRWSYAFAAAGASHVHGVEARQEVLDRFALFPDTPYKSRVSLHCNDLFDELEQLVAKGVQFDVIAVLGVFYHVMDHFRLLTLCRRLMPQIIIIDSEFRDTDESIIQVVKEETVHELAATSDTPGLNHTAIGVPSRKATEVMADALDYKVAWLDHTQIIGDDREGVQDYFGKGRRIRNTCSLTPK